MFPLKKNAAMSVKDLVFEGMYKADSVAASIHDHRIPHLFSIGVLRSSNSRLHCVDGPHGFSALVGYLPELSEHDVTNRSERIGQI